MINELSEAPPNLGAYPIQRQHDPPTCVPETPSETDSTRLTFNHS
jgi:hypothetical protein